MPKRKKTRITEVTGDIERRMVMGAVTSTDYLRRIQPIYRGKLLRQSSRYIATIMDWCLAYFGQYQKAPGRQIESIYHAEVRKGKIEEERADLIADLLDSVSREFAKRHELNVEYLLDKTREHFASLALDALADEIKDDLLQGRIQEAEENVAKFPKIALASKAGINPFTDADAMFRAFEQASTPLCRLKGALGDLLNDQMVRDGFIGIMAPEKRGKTFLLMDLAFAAIRARRNVAFFSVGDMSEDQMIVRMMVRLTGRNNAAKYCDKQRVPVMDCKLNQTGECSLSCRRGTVDLGREDGQDIDRTIATPHGYRPCSVCRASDDANKRRRYKPDVWRRVIPAIDPLTWRQALREGRRLFRRMQGRDFHLVCAPSGSLSVTDIRGQLDVAEAATGFVPDVVIIDYADILAPEPDKQMEFRHRENEKWKAMRRLSQERHCLVLTATQTDADAYARGNVTEKNFSEDKRKYAHVTGMLGMNQTPAQKEAGVIHANWVMLREGDFHVNRGVTILQCLARGQVHLDSFWGVVK